MVNIYFIAQGMAPVYVRLAIGSNPRGHGFDPKQAGKEIYISVLAKNTYSYRCDHEKTTVVKGLIAASPDEIPMRS